MASVPQPQPRASTWVDPDDRRRRAEQQAQYQRLLGALAANAIMWLQRL
jgi:hypothetical protein